MSISHSKMKKTIAAGIAALTLGGAAIASATPAEAQWGDGYGGECFVERRRSIDPWGRVVVRKIRTCY
jgi:hypothetical protein